MSEQDWIAKGLLLSQNPTRLNPSHVPEENVKVSDPKVGQKQWMTDLQTQLELGALAASTCQRVGRR